MPNRKAFFSFRSLLFLILSFLSVVSLTYAATTLGNNIFTSGTLTSQGKAYLTGGVSTPVLNATSSLIDNLTVDQNTSLATTTISNILTTQASVNFTKGMVSVKAPFKIEEIGNYIPLSTSNFVKVFVNGHYTYAVDPVNGLYIFDVSNPTQPVLKGSYDTTYYAYDVYVSGKYAYIANSYSGLSIFNISNPASPTLVGSYDTAGIAYGVYVSGHYAYVADGSDGLYIIDVSNPASPTLVSSYDTAGYAYGVYVSGKYAYVADYGDGLDIFDVSNPASPVLVGNYDTAGYAYGVYVSGRYAYVADGGNGLDVIDVSNPAAPILAGNYNKAYTGYAYNVYVSGNYAYLANDYGGLDIIDISQPTDPVLANNYKTTIGYVKSAFVEGNDVYLADGGGGLAILSLSGLSSPTANLGNIQSNNLTVTENTNLNQLNVNESLTVGKNALFNNDLTTQGNLNVLNNATINKALSATDISSDYATTSQYIALPTVKFIPTATPTNPKLGQCFMDNGAKPQVSCYDGTTWHTLW